MASRTLDVRINARDSASQVFKKVGDASKTMGDSIDRAADEGTRSLKDLDRQADATGDKFNTLVDRATAVGAALGTVGTVLISLGSAYRDQQRQVDGINRLYGEQADLILDMSDRIQDFTRYSNDAARESALVASSLSTNYQLTADQIEILIERSADLAQIFGTDLVDAVRRTSGAIRGEGEAAEFLSLNMSDAAIAARALDAGITNWNVPGALTEAEKAAFRFSVFMEDTEATVGAAAAAADNAGGSFRQFANDVQDGVQAVGGFLGPVGQVAAEFAPIAIAMPVVGAGLANLGRNAAVARVGMAGLALATNPVTIGLTAIVGVGALVVENMRRQVEEIQDYEASLAALGDTIEWLRRRGEDDLANFLEDTKDQVDDVITSFSELDVIDIARVLGLDPDTSAGLIQAQQVLNGILAEFPEDILGTIDEVNALIDEAFRNPDIDGRAYAQFVRDALDEAKITAEGSNLPEIITEILTTPLSEFRQEAEETFRGVLGPFGLPSSRQAEIISWETFTETVRDNIEAQEDEITVAEQVAAAHDGVADALEARQDAIREVIASIRELGGFADPLSTINLAGMGSDASFLAEQMQVAGTAFDNVFRVIVGNTNAIIGQADATQSWADELINVRGELGRIDELLADGFIDRSQYDAAQDAYDSISVSTENIRNNLQAVQAIQAPFVAENLEVVRAYTAQLRLMDEETQRTTLAFMDLQTVQEAQEIITLGNTEAFRNMGPAGREAFEAMIVGATTANPLLLDVLESMGAITRTADGGFDINWDTIAEGGSAIQQLTDNVEDLVATLREIHNLPPLDVEVATSITGPLAGDGSGALGALAGGGNALLDFFGIEGELTVPVTVTPTIDVPGNAIVGGATGNIVAGFAAQLGIPESVDVAVTPSVDVQGAADVEAVKSVIDTLPESTTISVIIDVDDSQLEGLGAFGIYSGGNEGGGAAALPEYSIPVSVDVTGTDELAAVAETLVVLNLAETTPSVNVDTSGFVSGFDLVKGHIADLDDDEPTVSIDGAPGLWAVHYDKVKSQIADLDDDVATVTINAENNASAVIGLVSGSLALLDGRTATTYVDTINRTFFQTLGSPGFAHGGIPSFASGGMVPFWAGEHGPEIAHFATGGTALLPHEGMYAAPPMTYISPNNAVSNSYGGDVNITIQHYGGGADEFDRMVESRLVPAVERAVTRSNRAAGVR